MHNPQCCDDDDDDVVVCGCTTCSAHAKENEVHALFVTRAEDDCVALVCSVFGGHGRRRDTEVYASEGRAEDKDGARTVRLEPNRTRMRGGTRGGAEEGRGAKVIHTIASLSTTRVERDTQNNVTLIGVV